MGEKFTVIPMGEKFTVIPMGEKFTVIQKKNQKKIFFIQNNINTMGLFRISLVSHVQV